MRRLFLVLPFLFLLPALSFGNDTLTRLANGLGITEGQAQSCLRATLTEGQEPTQAQRRTLYTCFKAHNPDLTPGQARAAMQAVQP